jgi:hypothetical protein
MNILYNIALVIKIDKGVFPDRAVQSEGKHGQYEAANNGGLFQPAAHVAVSLGSGQTAIGGHC